MRIAWLDCFSGISGDMCLGALLDAGVSLNTLKRGLKKVPLKGYDIRCRKVRRAGVEATKVDVSVKSSTTAARKWKDVRELLGRSDLSENLKKKALSIFRRIFEAEASVHGGAYNRVHLHEMGAVDIVVDVVGTLICLDALGIEEVCSSPINVGGGTINTSHGIFPVPAPATAELLKGLPVYSGKMTRELTTPTGAAILSGIASVFGLMPSMSIEKIGYGAGERNPEEMPNVLRVLIGETDPLQTGGEEIALIEANIDDMNPQAFEHVTEKLLEEGALDVYLTQVIMKKGRPGVLLTVLCPEERRAILSDIIFTETTTIGLRFWWAGRSVLSRTIKKVDTPFGRICIKEASLGGVVVRRTPEYEECRRAAKKHGVPLIQVLEEANMAARHLSGKKKKRKAK